MTLEVAKIGLKVSSEYMLKTHVFAQFNAVCTKIMSIEINLLTVFMCLLGILMPKVLNQKIEFWQLLDSTQRFELLAPGT